MELKDVILSTLAEMEDPVKIEIPQKEIIEKKVIIDKELQKDNKYEFNDNIVETFQKELLNENSYKITETEIVYLTSIKERLLVLFEGFQSPNNTHIETKVDITLNFLEYILSTIELRINSLEKEEQ